MEANAMARRLLPVSHAIVPKDRGNTQAVVTEYQARPFA